jgi:hypothetical protein
LFEAYAKRFGGEGCYRCRVGTPNDSKWKRGVAVADPNIPAALLARAHRSPNGELTWPRHDAAAAIEALTRAGYAMLGGEAWVILPDGRILGQLPAADAGPTLVYAWSVKPAWQRDAETWEEYARRAADYNLNSREEYVW